LRAVRGRLNALSSGQVSGTHLDAKAGADAQPLAPLRARLGLERSTLAALDGCLGEHRVTEEPAAARENTRQGLAVVDHPREAQVVAGLPRDPGDVTAAGLVDGDGGWMSLTDTDHRVLDARRVIHLGIAAGDTGQAQIHLHQRVRRA